MRGAIQRAGKRLAKIKHELDNATVTIKTLGPGDDPDFADKGEPVAIVTDYPARVIKGGLSSKEQREFLPDQYDAILVIDTGIEIPAGCTIDATNINGVVTHYKRATRGYGYLSHQEVAMVLDTKA
ncbi:hypothetical protein [Lacticaseibacillus sharpeae]|uniref:Uncharacterized protein n=1 Tax=Lacticaseibacillus sharpeae JCM 1186 = DSM 20505 TaxID=1291052 RepID=A0A0R1ZJS4_9LACO|nr:hypothetical protein [Lacticaseibacillus sharpeae]KRM54618.1 hypothetical protein FC18_GL002328 [Lacticaseibacillus sharpeae JCM 1186 = DSM 20505]